MTDPVELIERLRADVSVMHKAGVQEHGNLLAEAATALSSQAKRIAELEGALERIKATKSWGPFKPRTIHLSADQMAELARVTLNKEMIGG